jgi:septal ring factor EnvC (AmiA/AmiB activator)
MAWCAFCLGGGGGAGAATQSKELRTQRERLAQGEQRLAERQQQLEGVRRELLSARAHSSSSAEQLHAAEARLAALTEQHVRDGGGGGGCLLQMPTRVLGLSGCGWR